MNTTLIPPQQQTAPNLAPDGSVPKPWYKRDFYVGQAVKIEEVMNFSRQLSSFLRAGVPILDSLGVVGEENASKKMREVLAITDELRQCVVDGRPPRYARELALQQGLRTLQHEAVRMVEDNITTMEEVVKQVVVGEFA